LDKEIPQISASAVSSSSSSSAATAAATTTTTAAAATAAANTVKAPAINVSLHTKSAIVPFNPIKYQYYQGNDSLNISVLEKNLLPEDVNISIESDHLRVVCKGEVVIDKQLYGLVNTEKSRFEIRKSKVEIILWKVIFYFNDLNKVCCFVLIMVFYKRDFSIDNDMFLFQNNSFNFHFRSTLLK
jgi:hypothetical protein